MKNSLTSSLDLAPDYYLTNFNFLVDWVMQQHQDMLNNDEKTFIAHFQKLNHQSQCLFVRLSSRKGPLFRADKLQYSEINSIALAANELIAVGLLHGDTLLHVSELATLLTKVELIALFNNEIKSQKSERKEFLVELLEECYPEPKLWLDWTQKQFGEIYRLDNQHIVNTLLLIFFGNSYQNLTEFVLQDLGLFRYENYSIDKQHRIFKSRDELEQYQQLVALKDQLEQASTIEGLIELTRLLPHSGLTQALERRRGRLCNQLAYQLERLNAHSLALELYTQTHLPPARERRIRLLEKSGDHATAWALLNELIKQPYNEEELQIAERIAPRLAKKLGQSIQKKPKPITLKQNLQLLRLKDESGMHLNVEEIAQQYFDTPETPCFYVENLLISGLFGLWLWPEMFRGIDGAFANPFQATPLDMYQENFISNRPDIQLLWECLDEGLHKEHILTVWKEKNGTTNHFVHWEFLEKELIEIALECIPAEHLKMIFERLLFDIKNNRSGLPDLIQFYPETKNYRMIEIKGPGDRIQDNQQRWLDYFAANNIPAEVFFVSWQ
ncbi:MAG: VRR-NUC domain-containing protein [Pseudomonadota bacterium]